MTPAPTLSGRSPVGGPAPLPPDRVRPGPGVRALATGAAVVAVLVHLWGLYRQAGPPSPPWFPQADKVEHLVGFGLPCFLVLLAAHLHARSAGRLLRRRTIALVVSLFVVHAVVSEVVQGTAYTSRAGDPYDALADLAGTALGFLGHLLVRRAGAGVAVRGDGVEGSRDRA